MQINKYLNLFKKDQNRAKDTIIRIQDMGIEGNERFRELFLLNKTNYLFNKAKKFITISF